MSDRVDGIRPTLPAWPAKPVAPANRERETGRRKKPVRPPEDHDPEDGDREGDDRQPTIDEYI